MASDINPGDRFARVGRDARIYIVRDVRLKPGHPPHAQLVLENSEDTLLISVSALQDRALYRRV